MTTESEIASVRAFNRFYTRQIGLLDDGWLNSEFSLTEVRVLYELAQSDCLTASRLCEDLALDAGYLSRILKKFEKRGLIKRTPSKTDARRAQIALTDIGKSTYRPLEDASCREISSLLEPLAPRARQSLVGSMQTVMTVLNGEVSIESPFIFRDIKCGDIGWIIHRHGVLYNREYGWNEEFEALVAEIAGDFVRTRNSGCERAWIAERDGEIAGSIFVVRDDEQTARLRLLYVEPAARGHGIGRRLVREAIDFARSKNYETLKLWTNDVLHAARKIYLSAGFELVSEEGHARFGKDVIGQHWSLDLKS